MRVGSGLVAVTCLALSMSVSSACSASDSASQTLAPLPIAVPTTVVAAPDAAAAAAAAAAAGVSATSAPGVPGDTTTEASSTTVTVAVTVSTTAAATTTTIRPLDATVAGTESLRTWIMQLGATSGTATAQAVAALVGQLSQISAAVKTLKSADWPAVFQGRDHKIIFYVGGFASRDAVIAQCAKLGLAYPTRCLARYMVPT